MLLSQVSDKNVGLWTQQPRWHATKLELIAKELGWHIPAGQCEIRVHVEGRASTLLVAPPNMNSLILEWP